MAIGTSITEIADSEEEPLTSSPAAVPDAPADKLSATAGQDAQAVAWPHPELAEHTANEGSRCTDVLDVDSNKSSIDIETTHIDHSDLQSTHETATNNASARVMEGPSQAVTTSQAIVGAPQQDIPTVTKKSGGEAASLQDAWNSPEVRHTMELSEPAGSQTDEQIHSNEPQDNQPRPKLQDHPPDSFLGRSLQHDSASKVHLQHDTVNSHSMVSIPPQDDSSEQQLFRLDDASASPHEIPVALENDCLAARSGLGVIHEATIDIPVPASVEYPETTAAVVKAFPDTFHASDCVDLNAQPKALDLPSSGATPGQPKTIAASPAPPHTSTLALGKDLQHATTPAAASSTPAASTECTAIRNGHNASEGAPLTPVSMAPGEITDSNSIPSDQHEHDITLNTITTNDHIEAESMTALKRQNEEQHHALTGPVIEVTEGPTFEIVASIASDPVRSYGDLDPSMTDCQGVASKTTGDQTEFQYTTSQTSEPPSPRPVVKLSPQEVTLAELRAQKAALLSALRVQPAIQVLMEETHVSDVDMSDDDGEPTEAEIMAAANKIVKEHIKLLHEYNELKDVGQGLMGLISDQRGVRIVEVQDEFGIDAND